MPKLVLLDGGERMLTQWMFEAAKNEMGHLTLKEPIHLAAFIMQLQIALDEHNVAYDLTEDRPYPCDFCGRASPKKFCSIRCEEGAAVFPGSPKAVDWKAVAEEYRNLYERAVGADCEPEEAMNEHGTKAIAHTHRMLDKVVEDHTA